MIQDIIDAFKLSQSNYHRGINLLSVHGNNNPLLNSTINDSAENYQKADKLFSSMVKDTYCFMQTKPKSLPIA